MRCRALIVLLSYVTEVKPGCPRTRARRARRARALFRDWKITRKTSTATSVLSAFPSFVLSYSLLERYPDNLFKLKGIN